ncbi:adhesion G-protein coupled receptor D1-like isoform X2 [Acropora muricata]|uniref:adhesion G-protein coupled receptor D1-like isoform X2 n=1 Tax=Acropora muricata TaxID=159855 RepID=UPI0034E3BD78
MHRTENNLLWRIVFILVVLTIQGTFATRYGFEPIPEPVNWTTAAHRTKLAIITTLDESCDLALFVRNLTGEYWTPLRLNEDGKCQWGLNKTQVGDTCKKLLDKKQPGNCYVLRKHSMKLQPRNCSNSYHYMEIYSDDGSFQQNPDYSDECRVYKIRSCLHRETHAYANSSEWKALPYPWSCHKVASGELIGHCEIRRKAFNCCDYYCRPGNLTYTNNIGGNLSVALQKSPAGFGEKVEIVFKTGDMISLASAVFNNTGRIIAATLQETEEGMLTWKHSNNYTLRSNVIGVELSPPYNKTLCHLINITYSHAKVPHRDVKRKCVFWQANPGWSNGSWSSHGCSLLNGSSLEKTICTCNHLTSFAVLMQFNSPQKPISSEDKVALSVITYVGCLLSMMGELLVILVYIVFMKFKAEGIQIRLNLVTALFCAQLVFITGINATHNKSTCVSVAVLLHYLFLASFLWMLLEGVYLYVLIVEVFSTIKVWYLYVFAWGSPIIPVVISLGISSKDGGVLQNYTNPNFCWLSFSNKLSWSFIAPVLIVTLVNVIILVAVLREMRNLKDLNPTRLKSFKKGLKACIILAPLLGLTWVFGLLTATDAGLVFQYIFTILNSTQGLLIFLLHVVRNSDVRAEIHHKLLKWRFERSVNRVQEKSSTSTSRAKQRCCAESRDEVEDTQHSL